MDWDAVLKEEMDAAVMQRIRLKGDDEFQMSVKVVGPAGQIASTGLMWRDEAEKHFVMALVAKGCMVLNAQAVIVTSDSRFLDNEVFCKRFNVPRPEVDFEGFDRERRRVMAGFKNYYGNLPSDCYRDALIVAAKGPSICRLMSTAYRWSEGGFVFAKTEEQTKGILQMNLIPTWWKEIVH